MTDAEIADEMAETNEEMNDEAVRAEAAKWILERAHLRALIERFPPACEVQPLRKLVCPRYGARAWINSYTDDGQVSVVQEDNDVQGYCDPDWLEPIAFSRGMTPEWVRGVFAGQQPDAKE